MTESNNNHLSADTGNSAIIAPLSRKEKDPINGGKRRKTLARVLSAVPGLLVGAGVMFGVKSAAVASAAVFSAPASLTLAGAAAAVGFAAGGMSYIKEKNAAKNAGVQAPDFWTKGRLKTMGFHSAMTIIGGLLFTALDGIFPDEASTQLPSDPLPTNNLPGIEPEVGPTLIPEGVNETLLEVDETVSTEPPPLTLPDTTVLPEPEDLELVATAPPILSAFEQAQQAIGNTDCITDRVKDAMIRAENGSAQGLKDIAYFMFNGFDCVTQNQELAVKLFEQASEMGNIQAQVDLSYIQYHGLAGVEANPIVALESMKTLAEQDTRAHSFVNSWGSSKP